jgi:uncharacterized membrane protein
MQPPRTHESGPHSKGGIRDPTGGTKHPAPSLAKSYFSRPGPLRRAGMQEKRVHQIFVVSVTLKGLHALVEIAGGLALYVASAGAIARWLNEMDPHSCVARHFPLSEQHFYAFYLLSHGLVKAVLVFGLLRERIWAYPASFAVFGAFIAYQLYRYSYTHEIALILLSIFDLFVIYLAAHEYRLLRKHLPTH